MPTLRWIFEAGAGVPGDAWTAYLYHVRVDGLRSELQEGTAEVLSAGLSGQADRLAAETSRVRPLRSPERGFPTRHKRELSEIFDQN